MGKLAITGGAAVHTTGWPSWPPKDPGYLEKLKAVLVSAKDGAITVTGAEIPKTLPPVPAVTSAQRRA